MDMKIEMIDLKGFFEIQTGVDMKIIETQGIDYSTTDLKIIAFKVEFGEFLNEHKFFKFWKVDNMPRTKGFKISNALGSVSYNPLLEEFADCIAFMLALALERGWDKFIKNFDSTDYRENKTLPSLAIDIFHNPLSSAGQWNNCLVDLLQLAYSVGLNKEEIETAYLEKSQINVGRQENGY